MMPRYRLADLSARYYITIQPESSPNLGQRSSIRAFGEGISSEISIA
ncbi:MAG: hypothetical protein ABSG03_36730 [Bryobacteraceae bacterium]|jgi:hypothetical protein